MSGCQITFPSWAGHSSTEDSVAQSFDHGWRKSLLWGHTSRVCILPPFLCLVNDFSPETKQKKHSQLFYQKVRFLSLVAQLLKNMPAMWETWVRSLDWEDPLEKGKATHSSILAWRIPWTEEPMGSQRVGHDWVTFTLFQVCLAAAKNYNSGRATVITACKSGKAERTLFYRGGREVVINKQSIKGNIGV